MTCKQHRQHLAIAYLGLLQALTYRAESDNPQIASRHVVVAKLELSLNVLLPENIILGAQLGRVGFLRHGVCYVNSVYTVHINHYMAPFLKVVKPK